MNKKLLILGVLCSLFLLGGCPIPLNTAICGNDICEAGELRVCPGDCGSTAATTGTTSGTCNGYACNTNEYCPTYWLNDEHSLCFSPCETDTTVIFLQTDSNYVSFPQPQLNEEINSVITGDFKTAVKTVYTYYNNQWYFWHSDGSPGNLNTLEAGRGYIFEMNSPYDLSLSTLDSFVKSDDPILSVDVSVGWHLIGVSSGEEIDKEKPIAEYLEDITINSAWGYTSHNGELFSVRTDIIDVSCSGYSTSYNLIPSNAYWVYSTTATGEITP